MTTVGYGDFYPNSLFGKIIAIASVIIGNIILSTLVVGLTNYLEMNVSENKGYIVTKKLIIRRQMQDSSARIITRYFIMNHLFQHPEKKEFGKRKYTKKKLIETFRKYIFLNKYHRLYYRSIQETGI